jgi:predicted NUDIX family NTP pyrophosphohydrolase
MHIDVPELDRVAWFSPEAARAAMNPAQASFVDRLLEALGAGELHRRPTWAD